MPVSATLCVSTYSAAVGSAAPASAAFELTIRASIQQVKANQNRSTEATGSSPYGNLITPSHPPFRHERQILLDSSMVLGGEDGTQQGSVPEGPEHV
jgi:hypothetical protein